MVVFPEEALNPCKEEGLITDEKCLVEACVTGLGSVKVQSRHLSFLVIT